MLLLSKIWSATRDWLVEALSPTACMGCGRYGQWVCEECWSRIVLIRQQRCVGCHAISDFGKTCAKCKRKGWAIDGVMALTSFDQELVSEIVHAVKYRGQSAAGKWLGRRMAVGLPAWMLGGEYVFCAVPLHWWREWQRGFNQARLLLLGVVDFCGVREEAVLIKKRPSIAQARSGRRRRFANLVGAFAAKGDVAGARVVLVDDVATTGATLNAAARELKLAGARRVWGAVLARR